MRDEVSRGELAAAGPSREASHYEQSDVVLDAVVTEPLCDDPTAGRFSVVAGHERSSYELQAFEVWVRVLVGCLSAVDQAVGVEREGSPRGERDVLAAALLLWIEAEQQARRDIGNLGERLSSLGDQRCRVARVADRHEVEGGSLTAYTTVAEISLSK